MDWKATAALNFGLPHAQGINAKDKEMFNKTTSYNFS